MNPHSSRIRNRRFWLWVAAVLLIFALLLLVIAPPAMRLGLERWLEAQGPISAEIDEVEINPFTGTVVIHTVLAEREEAPGKIVAERASLSLKWWPLWQQRLMIDRIAIREGIVTVRQEDGTWYIGGLKFTPGKKTTKSRWQFGLDAVDLQNVQVRLLTAPQVKTITVVSARLDSLQAWNPEAAGQFALQLQVAGGSAAVEGKATPFAEQPAIDARLRIADFSLPWLQPWLPEDLAVQAGVLDAEATITGRYRPEEKRLHVVVDSVVAVAGLQGAFAGTRLEGGLRWEGAVEARAPREDQPPLLTAAGAVEAGDLAVNPAQDPRRLTAGQGRFQFSFRMGTEEVPADAEFLLQSSGTLRDVRVADTETGLTLVQLDTLEMQDGRLAGTGRFDAGSVQATGLRALEIPAMEGEKALPALTLAELRAQQVAVAVGKRIAIGELHLNGIGARLVRSAAGEIDLGPWLPFDRKTPQPAPAIADKAPPITVHLGLLQIGGENRLLLLDRGTDPPARFVVSPLQARLENLDSGAAAGPATFAIDAGVNGHPLSLQGKGEPLAPQPTFDGHLQLEGFPLPELAPYLRSVEVRIGEGRLWLNSDLQLSFAPETKRLQMNLDGLLRVNGLRGAAGTAVIDEGDLSWRGQLQLATAAGSKPAVSARGQLNARALRLRLTGENLAVQLQSLRMEESFATGTAAVPANAPFLLQTDGQLQKLRVDDQRKKLTLLSLASLRLQGGQLAGTGQVAIRQLHAAGVQALQRPPAEREKTAADYLLSAEQLSLEGLRLTALRRLAVQSITIGRPAAVLVREEQGFTFQRWFSGEKKPEKKPAAGQQAFQYAIGSVEIAEGRLSFSDRSVAPAVELEITPFNLRARGVDSSTQGQSAIDLEGRFSPYSTLRLRGTVQAFTPAATADLQLTLENFTLPKITAYPEKFIGYRIESGNLDLRADLNIRQGQLDSTAKVDLVKLELVPVAGEERADVTEQLGFPLGAGLAMLRDKGGTISLSFPITGDLKNPQIGIAGVVQKAFLRAVRSAALSYFSPLGAAALIGKRLILDRALALRFQPAYFPPGSAELPPATREYLQKTAEKLSGRPNVNVVLCGVAVPADTAALAADSAPAASAEGAETELLELAKMRETAVREFLVNQGVEAGRLVSCSPEVDRSPGARPRVEIGI